MTAEKANYARGILLDVCKTVQAEVANLEKSAEIHRKLSEVGLILLSAVERGPLENSHA